MIRWLGQPFGRSTTLTKITRENLPASMPPEEIERILRLVEARDRISWKTGAGYIGICVAVIGVMVAAIALGWPPWVPGFAMAAAAGATAVLHRFGVRQVHRALGQGHTCPHCHRGIFTDTWSLKEQERQREALGAGICPRCAIQLSEPHVIEQKGVIQRESR